MDLTNSDISKYVAEIGVETIKKTSFRRGVGVGIILTVMVTYLYEQLKPAKVHPAVKDVTNG